MTDKEKAFIAWEKLSQCINIAYYIGPKDCKMIGDALRPIVKAKASSDKKPVIR